jgi:ribosomal protein L7/L12
MEQEYHKRIVQLEARMNRIEAMMQALLMRLGVELPEVMPQEAPEVRAIREALLMGDKITAIKLYRAFYDVGLKEAKDAIDSMGNLHR